MYSFSSIPNKANFFRIHLNSYLENPRPYIVNSLYTSVTLQVLAPFSVSHGVILPLRSKYFLCSRRDSNPYLLFRGKILSLLCMPVPPLELKRKLWLYLSLCNSNYTYPPTLGFNDSLKPAILLPSSTVALLAIVSLEKCSFQ